MKAPKNPWTNFNLNQNCFVLESDQSIVEKFNENASEIHRIRTEIPPAPYAGKVFTAPVLLLLTNPGYDKEEEERGHYNPSNPYWKIGLDTKAPLFLLDDEYTKFCVYWLRALKYLVEATCEEKVIHNLAIVQFFPYHTTEFSSTSKFDTLFKNSGYLESQKYNFYLVEQAIKRGAIIILTRGKERWFTAVPALQNYTNLHFTNNPLQTTLSKGNLPAFDLVVERIARGSRQGFFSRLFSALIG